MRKVNFIRFPSNSPGKTHAVFKLYLGVRCQVKKWTIVRFDYLECWKLEALIDGVSMAQSFGLCQVITKMGYGLKHPLFIH